MTTMLVEFRQLLNRQALTFNQLANQIEAQLLYY